MALKKGFLLLLSCLVSVNAFQLNIHRSAFPTAWSSRSSARTTRCSASLSQQPQPLPAEVAGTTEAQVSVALVKRLRQLTAAGYGRCVKALQHSGGDIPQAVQWLRQQGAADAAAAAAAAATAEGTEQNTQQQGIIALYRLHTVPAAGAATGGAAAGVAAAGAAPRPLASASAATSSGAPAAGGFERVAAVHLGCGTDFVARSDIFTAAARRAAAAACRSEAFAAEVAADAAVASAAAALGSKAAAAQQHQSALLQRLLSLPVEASTPAEAPATAEAAAAATAAASAAGPAATTAGRPTVREDLAYISRLVGEKVVLKSVTVREARKGAGLVASYCHQPLAADVAPIAVLLHLSYTRQQQHQQQQQQEEEDFEKQLRQFSQQLCMQIAATKPLAIVGWQIPALKPSSETL